ncbi:MAG TPA: prolyl aminopeptidase [Alphaproteobacteria bacterium]|nr:prolyl aminopeptidase [Rhodospirillaceae bacterium]HRJ12698.1 prolyl aminopeptidase [Alphaproteobacteria bacterium]
MADLFPEIEPYASEYLSVGDGHELYIEQCGRASGAPILVVHGGPGSGCTPTMRRFFDPDYYRIILFDQRGSNRSRPLASLHENTPDKLVSDLEKIRAHLGIENWHIFGGSWGSTLSLLYAQAHPAHCLSLTLRGIFMMRQLELDWLFGKVKHVYPEEWALFINHLPQRQRDNPIRAYYELLRSTDVETVRAATRAWNRYENASSYLMPTPEAISGPLDDESGISRAVIECDYFLNKIFTPDDRILQNVDKLRGIPGTIIHGRYDMVCPITSAFDLHAAWPEAEFIIIPDSGHSANDPAMRAALIAATERLKTSGI